KEGWGHSSMKDVIEAAFRNGIKRLALIHHDPERTDDELDSLAAKLFIEYKEGDMEVFFAREGMEIDL
ncbi:MAG: MBL fold metallo-hydrolase, partial [Syntrophales bacterium]|nr:MBL fold metallo-hydrolase [Syntrophales bacterium]